MTVSGNMLTKTLAPHERGAATARAIVVRWEISPSAIRMSPLPEIAAMNGQAEKIGRAALEWRIEDGVAEAALRLEIGEDDVVVPLVRAVTVRMTIHGGGFRHVDAAELLAVTELDGRVLYARTDLLAGLLGLPGGVYEPPVASASLPMIRPDGPTPSGRMRAADDSSLRSGGVSPA